MNIQKINDIVDMYKKENETIVIDLGDSEHYRINEVYYELLEKKYPEVDLNAGKFKADGYKINHKSAYDRDEELLDLYKNNPNDVKKYFQNRKQIGE